MEAPVYELQSLSLSHDLQAKKDKNMLASNSAFSVATVCYSQFDIVFCV